MKIPRGPFLAKLNEAAIGLASKPTVEQSNTFVFKEGRLFTFNDEILVSAESPLDFDAAVNAQELLGVLGRLPDDEVDISLKGTELRIKGMRRSAGIACSLEVTLPVEAVPAAGTWGKLGEGAAGALEQAARVAGRDESQYLATCVHATPDLVEACDNFRMIRTVLPTGFPDRALLPATSVEKLEGLELTKMALGEGWVHFRTGAGSSISLRVSAEPYHQGIDALLELENPEGVVLPANLGEIVERAEVFLEADALVNVKLAADELVLTSRKEGGWYREKKRAKYSGRPLNFDINPKFLVEMLKHTRDVQVDRRRMAVAYDRTRFVVSLTSKEVAHDPEESLCESGDEG